MKAQRSEKYGDPAAQLEAVQEREQERKRRQREIEELEDAKAAAMPFRRPILHLPRKFT